MLYCPKCRRAYEEGKRRFCDYDGVRLLPAPPKPTSSQPSGGVFANLFGKISESAETPEENNQTPAFTPPDQKEKANENFGAHPESGEESPAAAKLDPPAEPLEKSESLLETEAETLPAEMETETPKPLPPRVVRPNEIPSGTASVGDRKTNPTGRTALSWKNPDALLGQTIKGRYQVAEKLEEDAESIVYLAVDKIVEGRKAVVRVFMEADFEEFDFADKRVSLAHLKHPNIAAVFDSGELPEGKGFVVSEYVAGRSVRDSLRGEGKFDVLRAARIIRQISYALNEAHQNGICHGNLSPENIILSVTEAGSEQVKLLNFGLSSGDWTEENLVYKAPEEIEGRVSTPASDIYALGVIAYQMLIARLPFHSETEKKLFKEQKAGLTLLPTAFRDDLPPLTDKVLQKALAFNPPERFAKARDFGEAFFNALTDFSLPEEKTGNKIEASEKEIKPGEAAHVSISQPIPNEMEESPVDADIHITSSVGEGDLETVADEASKKTIREDTLFETTAAGNPASRRLLILIVSLIAALVFGFSLWFLNR